MDILETVINLTYIKYFPVKNLPKQKIYYSKNSVKKTKVVDCKFVCEKINNSSILPLRDVVLLLSINPYPTAFPYGNGMVLHFYQQQESSTTKTVHKVINKGLKAYV